jgi:methionyl-tRNA formyltransferase
MDEKLDNGPIIVQEAVEIGNRSQEELIRGTKRLGMDAIIKAVNLINAGGYELMPNPAEKGSYFTFPTRADVVEFRRSGKRFF